MDITSRHGRERRRAERFKLIPYDIPRGSVAAYYPEANVLAAIDSVAEGSNQPAFKSIVVTIQQSPSALEQVQA